MKNIAGKLIAAMLIVSSVFAINLASVGAQNTTGICDGLGRTGGSCGSGGETQVNNLITTVINIFSTIVGVVAVIMIIVGGFKYITSAGDSGNISSAKNTIMYAIVGLIIVAMAQIIVAFVIEQV